MFYFCTMLYEMVYSAFFRICKGSKMLVSLFLAFSSFHRSIWYCPFSTFDEQETQVVEIPFRDQFWSLIITVLWMWVDRCSPIIPKVAWNGVVCNAFSSTVCLRRIFGIQDISGLGRAHCTNASVIITFLWYALTYLLAPGLITATCWQRTLLSISGPYVLKTLDTVAGWLSNVVVLIQWCVNVSLSGAVLVYWCVFA